MKRLLFFLFPFVFFGCRHTPKQPNGGYNYPNIASQLDSNDYYSPLKGLLSVRDSFNYSYYRPYCYKAYNEPNLSLAPQNQDIFRLLFSSAFGDVTIITLSKNKIIAKQWVEGSPYPEYDSTRLTSIERNLYEVLYWNFPIMENIKKGRTVLDSVAKKNPQILDPVYYRNLLNKCLVPNKRKLVYTTHESTISTALYYKIISHINASGYWKMPYEVDCNGYDISDGFGVTLEANTNQKYNVVYRFGCPTDGTEFLEVCQEIIDAAKLKRPISIFKKSNPKPLYKLLFRLNMEQYVSQKIFYSSSLSTQPYSFLR